MSVRVDPQGKVLSAKVIRSSGNQVFDRSAEKAVYRASPLPLPQEQELYQQFQELRFNFNPEV